MHPKVPYGIMDFRRIREEGYYYVDKTSYIRKRDAIWAPYFRNIRYSFARNWGWWWRLVMWPAFACAAFIKGPRNLIRALKREKT